MKSIFPGCAFGALWRWTQVCLEKFEFVEYIETYSNFIAILVSCVVSMRQLFITAQNRSTNAKGSYQNSSGPVSKSSNNTPGHTHSMSAGGVDSPRNDAIPLSSLSIIHIHRDFEVTTGAASNSGDGGDTDIHGEIFA